MENISITTYRGFSKVKGRCSLNELIEKVRSSRYAALIEKIGRLISEGKTKEAENVKRQLDYFTVTANYHECRLAHSIAAYNDIITIDLDHLPEKELDRIRALIETDEARLLPHRQATRIQGARLSGKPRSGRVAKRILPDTGNHLQPVGAVSRGNVRTGP